MAEYAHLLFGVGSGTGPFCDDVLPSFIVGCKGECDTGEGGTKVDTDDELGLVAISTLDLDGRVSSRVLLRKTGRSTMAQLLCFVRRLDC